MPLPTFLQRKKPEPAPRRAAAAATEAEDSGALQAARTRARRRLIGAVVLLAVGIVVFPLVFETQPRPIATDLPIEVPARKDGGSVGGPARPAAKRPPATGVVPGELPVEPAPQVAAAAASAPAEPASAPAPLASKPAERVAAAPAPKPSAPPPSPKPVAKAEEAQRAKSLLEGKPAAVEAKEGRFVVQVGAFTDAAALKDARQRVEKLGLKTYTQVVETEAGKRTRVRVGPFATREEADHAAAKLKSAALPAAVLTL